MLVVKIELWPGGDAMRRKVLGVGTISNVGGTDTRGEYDVRLYGAGTPRASSVAFAYEELGRGAWPPVKPWRATRLTDFPRKRYGPWMLLLLTLVAALAEDLKKTARRTSSPE